MESDQSQKNTLTEGNAYKEPVDQITRRISIQSKKKKNYFCILPTQSYQISFVDDKQLILVTNRQYQTHKRKKKQKKGRGFPKNFSICLLNKQGGN